MYSYRIWKTWNASQWSAKKRAYFTTPAYSVVLTRKSRNWATVGTLGSNPVRFSDRVKFQFSALLAGVCVCSRSCSFLLDVRRALRARKRFILYPRLDENRKRNPIPSVVMEIANSVCAIECYVSRYIDCVRNRKNILVSSRDLIILSPIPFSDHIFSSNKIYVCHVYIRVCVVESSFMRFPSEVRLLYTMLY